MNQDTRRRLAETSPVPHAGIFRRLHALAPVGIRGEECVANRHRVVDCGHCTEACPTGALSLSDGAISLDPLTCSGCGRCAAACPTGALTVDGFTLPAELPPTGIVLACERSHRHSGSAEHRVPCLGGLALNDWLRLSLHAMGAPLQVLDDGACLHCSKAAATGASWLTSLTLAQRALKEAGVPDEALPKRVESTSLPNGNERLPRADDRTVASRRSFFTCLSRSMASTLTRPSGSEAGVRRSPLRGRANARRGDETRALLQHIALRHGLTRPRSAHLPALVASDACRAHGACARICPTGALQIAPQRDGSGVELLFDSWSCIDCGACVQLCPGQALTLEKRDWRAFAEPSVVVTTVQVHECTRCGTSFGVTGDETLCERCRKEADLAQAGFALFTRHCGETPASPEGP